MRIKRDERIGLVLTATEKTALRKLAEVEGGLSQAAVLRRMIRQEAERRGLWPVAPVLGQSSTPAREGVRA